MEAKNKFLCGEIQQYDPKSVVKIMIGTTLPDELIPDEKLAQRRQELEKLYVDQPMCVSTVVCTLDPEGIKHLRAELVAFLKPAQAWRAGKQLVAVPGAKSKELCLKDFKAKQQCSVQ